MLKKPIQVFNFSVQNVDNNTVDVYIDGQIVDASTQEIIKAWFGDTTSVSYKSFRESLNKETFNTLNVYINSPGGLVTDAMAIHDLLVDFQNKGKTVNTIGRGLVASSATLILLAGNKPQMSANSMFMVHSVSGGSYGTVDEIETYAQSMRKFNNMIVDLYTEKTGLSVDEVNAMMSKETWLTAKEAEDHKFIWKKIDNANFNNIYNQVDWNINEAILNHYNQSVQIINNLDMNFFNKLKTEIIAAIKGVPANTDHSALMNTIGEVLAKPFENMETEMTSIINTAVDAKVKTAIEAAIQPFTQQITDLETEIADIKGNGSQGGSQGGTTPIGNFA